MLVVGGERDSFCLSHRGRSATYTYERQKREEQRSHASIDGWMGRGYIQLPSRGLHCRPADLYWGLEQWTLQLAEALVVLRSISPGTRCFNIQWELLLAPCPRRDPHILDTGQSPRNEANSGSGIPACFFEPLGQHAANGGGSIMRSPRPQPRDGGLVTCRCPER